MAESVERYFRFLPAARRAHACERRWRPAADVYRVSDGWIVKIDLAGVAPDEVEVVVSGRELRISGNRRDTIYGEGVSYHQLEITYSRFDRTFQFPCSIESATLGRDYRDGLLILRLRSNEEDCE